jgi:hypothetical protein
MYEIITHGSLRVESEDSLGDFFSIGIEMSSLLEFVKFEYCSAEMIRDVFGLLSEDFDEFNASMRAGLRARLVLSNKSWEQFPPSVKKRSYFEVTDRIIKQSTRECRGACTATKLSGDVIETVCWLPYRHKCCRFGS